MSGDVQPAHADPAVVTRPTLAQLVALAGPVVVTRSAQVVVGFTDAAMVGHLGQAALAATTAGALNVFNVLVFPMGVSFVVQTFAAQLTGQGDVRGARRFGGYGLALAAATQVACMAAIPLVAPLVDLLGYAPDVKALMSAYLGVRLLSGGAAIGLEALGAYYGGLGNTRLPMVAQMLAMVLNVFFCWVLVSGNLGAPALGVQGSAWAAVIATNAAFLGLLGAFLAGVGCRLEGAPPSAGRASWAELAQVLRIGVPSGLNWTLEFLSFSFFVNLVMPGLGTSAVAALLSVSQLNSVAFMPAFGLASAGAIFVGQAIGADRRDDVPRTVAMTVCVAAAWMGAIGLTYAAFPALFLSVFVPGDVDGGADFVAIGSRMLWISCLWQVFDAAAMAFSEALRAAGDTLYCFVVRTALAWLVFAPGAWLAVRWGGGDVGAMASLCLYVGLLSLALFLRFRSGRWRELEVVGGAH